MIRFSAELRLRVFVGVHGFLVVSTRIFGRKSWVPQANYPNASRC
jgi:hypothetical protein